MASSSFPVPRAELPSVRVSPEELAQRKQQAEQQLARALAAFDEFAEVNRRLVDARRWKPEASKDKLRLLRERKPASADRRAFLLVGECAGRVEDALYALSCESHVEHALLAQFVHEDVADCGVLRVLEGAREDDPYRSLAYKWVAKAPSGLGGSKGARDAVYLEFSGTARTTAGKEIGFHVLQTVELPAFPELRGRQCARTARGQSVRTLFRQATESSVEVFLQADVAGGGSRGLLRASSSLSSSSAASVFSPDALFNLALAVKCGETKRLTLLIDECRVLRSSPSRRASSLAYHEEAVLCAMCRQEKKVFNTVTLTECEVCGTTICTKCRENRRIFVLDHPSAHSLATTGRFEKVSCCQTCAFNAKRLRPEAPAWASKRESFASSGSSSIQLSATHLQLRSASVASTVTSGRASSDTAGAGSSVHSSHWDDELPTSARMLARLSLDSADHSSRISVDSVDDLPVIVNLSEHEPSTSSSSSALVVAEPRRPVPPPQQHQHARAPHGMTPQAAYNHQMQLYLRMQQLTQQAEQTYQAARQLQPQPARPPHTHRP